MFTLLVMGGLAVGGSAIFFTEQAAGVKAQTRLAEARELLLAELIQPETSGVVRDGVVPVASMRLGRMGFLPDLPIAAGGGLDAGEPNYDGRGESSGCATLTWVPGQALRQVDSPGAQQDARCFGQFPWFDLGLTVTDAGGVDQIGDIPWVVVSPNLASDTCLKNLTPALLAETFVGYDCINSNLLYPWLRVVDQRGNLLSDRVAIAIILPGPALSNQVRAIGAGPAAWLDAVTVLPGCTAPCVPGTYDNAGYTHASNAPWTLIKGASSGLDVNNGTNFQTPYLFNDRLVFITIDQLMERLEKRARRVIVRQIQAFVASPLASPRGYFPFAAPLNNQNGECQTGLLVGHPAARDGSCGANESLDFSATPWFVNSGWHRYFVYAAAASCINDATPCVPGLDVAGTPSNALVAQPGLAIKAAPFVASKGFAQAPVDATGLLSANLNDYLDAVENADGDAVYVNPQPGATPDNDQLIFFN
jgi:hypothetical protein